MQSVQHIGTLLKAQIGLLIMEQPAGTGATASFNGVGTFVAADKMYLDFAIFFAFAYKLILAIRQVPEKGITHRLYNSCFTSPIGSTNGSCTTPEVNNDVTITFDILQLNARNEHNAIPQQMRKYYTFPNSLFCP